MRKNKRSEEKLALRLGTLAVTEGFTQSLTRPLTSSFSGEEGAFTVDSLNPLLWFDMDVSMLAAGDVAAAEGDLVATLENKVSGGPNATQTTASEQSVAKIPTDGNQPYLLMDLVDDEYEFTTDSSAVNGTIVVATLEGTYSANISLDASTQYDLQARGVASTANVGFLKNPVGYLVSSSPLSESEINSMENYFVDKGAAARSAFGSVTNFRFAWRDCNSLTSFPLINTSSGTDFSQTWYNCSSLTSFPEIDTSSGTLFTTAWRGCSSLTSFPEIDTSSGTSLNGAWRDCNSLTSFPLLNTSSGTNFTEAWLGCSSLTSFPSINTSSGTTFANAWYNCTSLTSFPLINTSSGGNFIGTWRNCSSLTSFPALNTSSVTNFSYAWNGCTSLTSFPLLDTSSGTNFATAWYYCTSLTSFPALDTSSGTNFTGAWRGCSSLTSFPLIDTSSGTILRDAWRSCASLTSFPLIDTSSATDLDSAWRDCTSLTSFPLIDTSSGTDFERTWYNCSSLTSFPSGFFDSWSPASLTNGVFNLTWDNCASLTAQSVENILTSLDTSGVYGTDTGASGGTQLADNTIDIDYDGTTLSSATSTAITNLKSKNWAISINSVIQ